ncbi:hypothetical protein X742_01310 [Mesorhizobium sp. LNHC232B00]|nr:hypothetical protein X742_01310 [Mesorhizobium sp. LNHC232B00]
MLLSVISGLLLRFLGQVEVIFSNPSGSKLVPTFCSSVIFSENRLALFAIML